LSGTIREGKDFLRDQIVLFGLASDNLEQGPVLVKQKIRISVAQNPGTLGSKHEELITSVGNQKRPALVFSTSVQCTVLLDFLLSELVDLAG
jgi:hypothetical protein